MANRFSRATSILVALSASAIYISNASTQADKHPELALASGDYRKAEDIYREELKRFPRSASLLTNLGIAVQMQGRSAEAISLFRRSLDIVPMDNTYALLAEERCKTRDLEEAKPMLANILKKRRLDPKTLALVAPCYLEADQPLDSVTVYQTLSTSGDKG
jgi:tetratricopeptide (TPR) repeat protein